MPGCNFKFTESALSDTEREVLTRVFNTDGAMCTEDIDGIVKRVFGIDSAVRLTAVRWSDGITLVKTKHTRAVDLVDGRYVWNERDSVRGLCYFIRFNQGFITFFKCRMASPAEVFVYHRKGNFMDFFHDTVYS